MSQIAFDPIQYKEGTFSQWQSAAGAWSNYGGLLRRWLGPATELMLDMCEVGRGSRVLDVAAGAGDQSLQTAERVGARGYVLATDLSPAILERARENARGSGLALDTRVMDGESLDVPPESFDAVISRVGMIYFPDQQAALRGMKAALRPGGRVGAITYSTADHNRFFSTPVAIIRRRAKLPPPLPSQPGPFSLGDPQAIEAMLAKAGFRDIEVRRVDAPVRMPTAADCVRFERDSFGALHQMLSALGASEQEEAWAEIATALREFERDGAFEGPCELLVAAATK